MRGIVLAGGSGTRLWPITKGISKQLLPVYDKPMVYYPITTLMLAGIREILIISTPVDIEGFKRLLGDGSQWGMSFSYAVQPEPKGIAQAFTIGAEFIGGESCALVLGDNIFHGSGFGRQLREMTEVDGANIFAYEVADPTAYGVVELDSDGSPTALVEKPKEPKSNLAIPGLYFYGPGVSEQTANLVPSKRGELEITDLNRKYMDQGKLNVSVLPRGTAWLDTGTVENLHDAGAYVRILEQRQGMKVGCIEEAAWRNGWLSDNQLIECARAMSASGYGDYLGQLLVGRK